MKVNLKLIAIILTGAVISIVSVAATTAQLPEAHYTNLKILPKNISPKDLNKIMVDDFEDGLGVACSFCHAQKKDNVELDFASDAKPEKQIARKMMQTTIGVNKTYFKIKHPLIGASAMIVTCNTCHRGEAFPEGGDTGAK